jgi:hypothetical protein
MLALGAAGWIRASTDGGGTWADINSAAGAGSTTLRAASTVPS